MRSLIKLSIIAGLFIPVLASAQTQTLPLGWSMVGNDTGAPIDANAVFGNSTIPTAMSPSVNTVWSWNNLLSRWNLFAPSMTPQELSTYSAGKGYGVLSSIAKGEGFWVNAKNQFLYAPIFATTVNPAPVANAGFAQNVALGSMVTLDGSASSVGSYAWELTSRPIGSSAALSSSTAVNPTFQADVAGTYVASLIVNNGQVNSTPATVIITTVTPVFSANCASCHTTTPVEAHISANGGYLRGPCAMCHGPTKVVTHHWYSMNPATRTVCGSCHTGIDFTTGTGTTIRGIYTGHVGGAFLDDTTCSVCHDTTRNTATHSWIK